MNSLALKALLSDASAYEVVEAPGARGGKARVREFVAVNAPGFAPWTA